MDVAGYSRMIESDDLRTALRMRHLHEHLVRPAVRLHGGRIVSVAGDGAMVAFEAASEALDCAVAIQRALDLLQGGEPADERLRLRMGISVGGVLEVEGELYGNALNVAARLEALAEPGGIYLSGTVFDHLDRRCAVRLEALGERKLRKIAASQRVYRVDRRELAGR
jgi:class 3 adenylate cyclase